MLGRLEKLGYGPGQVVTLGFHVDYFNEPWKDIFSDPKFSDREEDYSRIYNTPKERDSLYFTPMLMVDGQVPMLGTNEAKLKAALKRVLSEKPKIAIDLILKGSARERSLDVTVTAKTLELRGRALLVSVATTEGPMTTKIASGENAGATLVEHDVVRAFAVEPWKPAGSAPKVLNFPVMIEPGWDPAHCHLVAFVQDEATGRVYQAASIPLPTPARSPRP